LPSKHIHSWQISRKGANVTAHFNGHSLSASTPGELWLRIADHSAGHYIHLGTPDQTILAQVWPQTLRQFEYHQADALLGRIIYAEGTSSRHIKAVETCRYLNSEAGILCVTSRALAKAARAMPTHIWDDFWHYDLVLHLCATGLVRGTALTFARCTTPPPLPQTERMPYRRAGYAQDIGTDAPTLLIYGQLAASVSLYFDGLPADIKARLRFLQPGNLASDIGWLASASLVLVVRDFKHMVVTGALDLLTEIGIPYAWFIDDDLIALSREVAGFADYNRPLVETFLHKATALVVTSHQLADTYSALHRNIILWPCVYDAKLAPSHEPAGLHSGPQTLHIGVFGGAFRRISFQSHVQTAIGVLKTDRPVTLFVANDISAGRAEPTLRLMPFEPSYPSFIFRWQRLAIKILVHPYGETANIANKSIASILGAAYLGAVPVVGHEPAYDWLSEEHGVLKAHKNRDSWLDCLQRLTDPAEAGRLYARLHGWCQDHFNPENARRPFDELIQAALPGTVHHQALRWQMACQSATLSKFMRSPAALAPTRLQKTLTKLRRWWRHPFRRFKRR